MKNKFWLGLLAANSLLLVTNSTVVAANPMPESQQDIAILSQSITESIGLQPDVHSLIELAIGRALTAQKLGDGQATTPEQPPAIIAGAPLEPPTFNPAVVGQVAVPEPKEPGPHVVGQIAVPTAVPETKKPVPNVVGKIAVPEPKKPVPRVVGKIAVPTAVPEPTKRVRFGGARG